MKKSHVLTMLLCAFFVLLLVCLSNEIVQKRSEKIVNSKRTGKTDELSVWLKQYKYFLQGRVGSKDKENKESLFLDDYCNLVVPGKMGDRIRYALFDMTGDGMPELHVQTDISYTIHTIENHQLVEWYQGDQYSSPLNNGMILQKASSESGGDSYIFIDSKGVEVSYVWFGKNGDDYRFSTGDEDVKLSKNKWEKLKKPFLTIGSDKIIWKKIGDLDF